MCDKLVSAEAWALANVAGHWDHLRLQSGADGVVYKDSSVAALLGTEGLISGLGEITEDEVLFGGMAPVQGIIRPAELLHITLLDHFPGRSLTVFISLNGLGYD